MYCEYIYNQYTISIIWLQINKLNHLANKANDEAQTSHAWTSGSNLETCRCPLVSSDLFSLHAFRGERGLQDRLFLIPLGFPNPPWFFFTGPELDTWHVLVSCPSGTAHRSTPWGLVAHWRAVLIDAVQRTPPVKGPRAHRRKYFFISTERII
jgi:hypothetical protein